MTHHPRRARYAHGEAFCLMTYVAQGGSIDNPADVEVIWNSRDGVTPFTIALRDGRLATHHIRLARRAVDHTPAPGDRIFVDLTPDRAASLAADNAARWWASDTAGCRRRFGDLPTFVEALATEYLRGIPGEPDLVTVEAVTVRRPG